jgi:hypothetical protein
MRRTSDAVWVSEQNLGLGAFQSAVGNSAPYPPTSREIFCVVPTKVDEKANLRCLSYEKCNGATHPHTDQLFICLAWAGRTKRRDRSGTQIVSDRLGLVPLRFGLLPSGPDFAHPRETKRI